ncbi:HtrA2 peptidase [Desulfofarcimen acetoxidans DSM 771]|jgi:Do/DeqQ family serine protease|uniref:HtrA2 peptidase n=1 Tax=Desulfofarcimen acetoxidans (strain ATCC 49208 / DSM 771 / KCTC 5769 / VKM B-1644 / 5575) TaxID=485916 RepID=C8W3A8_DESAS|nr:trypsin-like peptidase domain-containing protein [Desulfofarcimen acetoxidans]ACV61875.1 HtrA2 peptidase [Desulfofarcimen acetoxidans DSM 771]
MQNWRRNLLFVAIAAFVAGLMFSGASLLVQDLSPKADKSKYSASGSAAGVGPDTIANIVDKAGASVVKISTTVTVDVRRQNNPFFSDPFFRQFFGPGLSEPRQRQETGLGSGFIISQDGYIVTNEHVIDGAEQIEVTMKGSDKPSKATVVGSDFDLDLAVIKIDSSEKLPVLKMGDSEQIKVGNWVIAIGNPYGLDHTVTIGVISAKGRPVNIEQRQYKNLLQTDASINPGNSGGPLLNLDGEVVGINTAINAEAQGIGFAIPTSTVKSVLDELIQKGKVVHPWMGVQLQPVTEQIAEYYSLKNTDGALVAGVVKDSPAEKVGLQQGDIILEIDGQKIKSVDNLIDIVGQTKVGQKLKLLVHREKDFYVSIIVNEKPSQLTK